MLLCRCAPQAQLKAQAKNKQPERRGCWLWINAKTLEGALDPLFIAFSLCVSLSAMAAGIYTIIKSNSFNFTVNSWDDFTQVGANRRVQLPLRHSFLNIILSQSFHLLFPKRDLGSTQTDMSYV